MSQYIAHIVGLTGHLAAATGVKLHVILENGAPFVLGGKAEELSEIYIKIEANLRRSLGGGGMHA
jgi:hypothetical protein